jgi:fibronectin-binding autotransporter adhesin
MPPYPNKTQTLMNKDMVTRYLITPAMMAASLLLGGTSLMAQTPPTPTHTFNATINSTFGTNTNWSADTLPVAGSHALIADGKTATMSQTNANTLFGSLTLGVNSIMNLAASDNQGPAAGSVLYFSNGSQLNYTSGKVNRANTYNILSGATVQLQLASTGNSGDCLPQGSLVGDSTTTVNFRAHAGTGTNVRWTNASFSGTLNFIPDVASNARIVNFTSNNDGASKMGPGITNFGSFVRGSSGRTNQLNDSGTLQLTGSSGGASLAKFDLAANTDTIGGLTIDTPIGATASAPTYRGSNTLTVSGTTTFQGTAGAVNFDSSNATPTSHNLITTGSMTFGGTGTWAVSGDGRINLNNASGTRTITTNTNASIANTLVGTQGFTKQGTGTLTLSGTNTLTGTVVVSTGSLVIDGAVSSTAITTNAFLGGSGTLASATIGGSGSVNPGNSPGIMTAAATNPSGGLDYNFELGTAGSVPLYSNAAASVNDVLRLTSATPFTASLGASNTISLYFGVTSLTDGDVFTGGFFTDNDVDFLASISAATFQYFLSDAGGATVYNGANYTLYSGPLSFEASTVAVPTAAFASGTVNGYVTQFNVVPEPSTALLGAIGLIALLRRRL